MLGFYCVLKVFLKHSTMVKNIDQDEIICLKKEINRKNMDINTLTYSLQNARDNIRHLEFDQLESPFDLTYSGKMSRNNSGEAKKCHEFYNKHKNDPYITDPFLETCRNVGLLGCLWYSIGDVYNAMHYIINSSSSS